MQPSDPEVRKGATGKLAHALTLAGDLRRDMDAWWSRNPVALQVNILDGERAVELLALTDPVPPVGDWYHRTADILQNFRDALNRLTYTVSYLSTAPSKPRDASFPIRRDEASWQSWVKKNPKLPAHLVSRFYRFQPFVSERPFLRALTDSNNIEKHEDGFVLVAALTELNLGGSFTVEGLWEDDGLGDQVELVAGETLDLSTGRQLIGRINLPMRILDFDQSAPRSEFTVTPLIRYDDEEIPALAAIDLIGREAAWAIAYITGLTDEFVTPPTHFDL